MGNGNWSAENGIWEMEKRTIPNGGLMSGNFAVYNYITMTITVNGDTFWAQNWLAISINAN